MNFEQFRQLTPAACQHTYLETPARGLTPRPVTQAMIDAAIGWQNLSDGMTNKPIQERVIQKIAQTLSAQASEIVLTNSTADGFNIFANAIRWKPTDNVVISDCEHPANFYPWLHLRRLGVDVRVVPSKKGIIDPKAIAAAMDDNTKFVAASLVTFYPGALLDCTAISRLAKKHHAYFVADAIQAFGFIPLNPREMGIDVLSSAAYKGLMSPYGSGFLYVAEEVLADLIPSQLTPSSTVREGSTLFPEEDYTYVHTASCLQPAPNHLAGLAAMDAGLDLLIEIGVENIKTHIQSLTRALNDGLNEIGFTTDLVTSDPTLSHIITVQRQDAKDLVAYARQHNLFISPRRDGIRFGFHAYNNMDDVEQAIAVLKKYQKNQKKP